MSRPRGGKFSLQRKKNHRISLAVGALRVLGPWLPGIELQIKKENSRGYIWIIWEVFNWKSFAAKRSLCQPPFDKWTFDLRVILDSF